MIYRPEWFDLEELVPPDIFEARGEAAWELLDPRALLTLDHIRGKFGPTTVNNWREGGPLKERGFRSATSATGAKFSQHRYGRGFDSHCENATPQEVFAYIREHPDEFPQITTLEAIEATPTWVHFDTRNNMAGGIRVVKP